MTKMIIVYGALALIVLGIVLDNLPINPHYKKKIIRGLLFVALVILVTMFLNEIKFLQ